MATTKQRKKIDESLAAVVAHPLRARAFMLLAERTASPRDIATTLGEEVNDVAYHVRKLRDFKLIELVGSRPVRGATEHFYRAIKRPMVDAEEYALLDQGERNGFAREILQLVFADVAVSIDSGVFSSRPDNQVVRAPMLVDDQGYEEISKIHDEALDKVLEVQAASAERMTRDSEARGIHVESVNLFFERDMNSKS